MLSCDVFIIDDHPVIGMAVSNVLADHIGVNNIQCFTDPQDALRCLKDKITQTIVVLDLEMPGLNGMDFLRMLLKENLSHCYVLIYTSHDDLEHEILAIRTGAKGYISKSLGANGILNAFNTVMSERTYFRNEALQIALSSQTSNVAEEKIGTLSKRELEIATRLAAGKSNSEIADDLFISPKTVSAHKANLFEKLAIENIPALIDLLKKAQCSLS